MGCAKKKRSYKMSIVVYTGKGRGFWNHGGRPGKVGGSKKSRFKVKTPTAVAAVRG